MLADIAPRMAAITVYLVSCIPFFVVTRFFPALRLERKPFIIALLICMLAVIVLPKFLYFPIFALFATVCGTRANDLRISAVWRWLLSLAPVLLPFAAFGWALIPGARLTELHRVAAKGNLEALRVLADNASSLDVRDEKGATPLMYAARYGHSNLVVFLIDRGADLNLSLPDGTTARELARLNGHAALAELLESPRFKRTAT